MSRILEFGDSPDTNAFNAINPPTTFRDLAIGQTFDFVDDGATYHSFLHRCTKVSPRCYTWLTVHGPYRSRVGTINVEVFHVGDWGRVPEPALPEPCFLAVVIDSAGDIVSVCHRLAEHDGLCSDWAPDECIVADCACTEVEEDA